ncbi:Hypp4105 [Branchiostoma lanceolatum]|uniref:Hypp4105 protein n=1 Tax=Branchiostoma lanceolatum TaxID=7740 RepID=A0A8K0EUD1_BRALA|nr:Hypp4105 [Branchiostoma lanceolatum]
MGSSTGTRQGSSLQLRGGISWLANLADRACDAVVQEPMTSLTGQELLSQPRCQEMRSSVNQALRRTRPARSDRLCCRVRNGRQRQGLVSLVGDCCRRWPDGKCRQHWIRPVRLFHRRFRLRLII